jgi:hypothetical protein
MTKASISSIERRKDGSLLINYWSGGAYKFQIFYYYSKRDALRKLRQELGIKRNPSPIRDYTVTPKPSLTDSLVNWHKQQGG